MTIAKVDSKGRITIPIEIRKRLDLQPGDRVRFAENEKGEFVLRRIIGPATNLKD
jgi:AbrB family looped-hinge helix DNA binding protein